MRYWYDWEFLENGHTIEPISIGIVAEDGRELYLVNQHIEDEPLQKRIVQNYWLMENVVPHLPLRRNRERRDDGLTRLDGRVIGFHLDSRDNQVVTLRFLRNAVREFLTATDGPIELWGYYSAYDHVCLMQLFGAMIDRPDRFPMWTNDVQQLAAALGLDNSLPTQTGTAHNALHDARWTRDAWQYLEAHRG